MPRPRYEFQVRTLTARDLHDGTAQQIANEGGLRGWDLVNWHPTGHVGDRGVEFAFIFRRRIPKKRLRQARRAERRQTELAAAEAMRQAERQAADDLAA